jgi:hypothetical protein
MFGKDKRNTTLIVNHLKTLIGDPEKDEAKTTQAALYMRRVWVGLLVELIPHITFIEIQEITKYSAHSTLHRLLQEWRNLDWRVRYSWLCFVESSAIELDWPTILRDYTDDLAILPMETQKKFEGILTRKDLLQQWQQKQMNERWEKV